MTKYRSIPIIVDGIRFPSKREAKRWKELRLMNDVGAIHDLRRQVRFPIVVNGVKVCAYVADFVYAEDGQTIVEDCKGFKTDVYKLKAKLMLACHNVVIRET